MKNDWTLKNLMKLNAALVMIIGFCDIIIIIFFQGLNSWEKWKVESIKIFILLLVSSCIIVLLFNTKIKRKTFSHVIGIEILIFSIVLFFSIMKGYYNIYEILNYKLLCVYAILSIVAYLLSRKVSRKLYEKLSLGEKIGDKNGHKIEDGALSGIVLCTIASSRYLTMNMQYVVNVAISFGICFFWLFMGFFMLVMKPMNEENTLDNNNDHRCKDGL